MNFNGFSMIDVHQNAALSESFEGDRSRVIGNHGNFHSLACRGYGVAWRQKSSGPDTNKNLELHTSAFKDDITSISFLNFVVNSES